ISGLPETISIDPLFSDSNTTTHLIDFVPQLGGLGTKPGGAIRSTVHSILPTGGFFNFVAPKPTALPEYSLEPGGAPVSLAPTATAAAAAAAAAAAVAPRDHAASAAAEIARKISEGGSSVGQLGGSDGDMVTPPSFLAGAVKSVRGRLEIRERRAAVTTRPTRGPAGIDSTRVPNLWLAVAHSSSLKAGKAIKVEVDGVPIALWRSAAGSVSAMSDVCIHRGASLARGWVATDRLVCPCETLCVVVKNEFHLPYRAVIRVYFGENSLKTIEATAVPKSDGETTLHWKLYRNFAITHPLDEGPVNKAGDFLFRQMMELTLREDKEIIENIYPEYQRGFMNARYDKQVLQYRKGLAKFQAIAAEHANTQVESSLQMELLHRISSSQRGLASTRSDRFAILDLIQRLEDVQATSSPPPPPPGAPKANLAADAATTAAAAEAATEAAKDFDDMIDGSTLEESVEGEWHLEFVSNEEEGAGGWDFTGSTDPQKMERV
ncbi:unnamed protein product, partial [Laminaria digitata]